MSVLPPGRLPIVPESVRSDRRAPGRHRDRPMRCIAYVTPAIDRM